MFLQNYLDIHLKVYLLHFMCWDFTVKLFSVIIDIELLYFIHFSFYRYLPIEKLEYEYYASNNIKKNLSIC